jgi:hypothetical protein
VLTLLLLVTAACDDDTTAVEEEPEVATMRLVVGAQTINVADDGTVTGGPMTLVVGANTVTATFLGANGQPEPLVTTAEFQLNVEVLGGAPITFQRSASNAFSGTLTATAAGQGRQLRFSLFHIEEQHEDFGPFTVTVNVN